MTARTGSEAENNDYSDEDLSKQAVAFAVGQHALVAEIDVINNTLNERQNDGGITGDCRKLFCVPLRPL